MPVVLAEHVVVVRREVARTRSHGHLVTAAVLALVSALGFGAVITTPSLADEVAER